MTQKPPGGYNRAVADLKGVCSSSFFAEMTELADVQDLGSCAARREGSSPFFRSWAVVFGENPEYLLFVLEKSEYIVYDNTVYI